MNERYLEYLASREWKAKRAAVKKRCNDICERYHRYLVDEVHHLTYDRVYSEGLEDLQGLCAPCHAFLHGSSGIDPLQESIHIKVSWKCIEYWDTKIGKFRRVSMAKLGKPNGNHYHEPGQFNVPMDVFLDETGHPIFDLARWQKFKTAYRNGKHWMSYGPSGHPSIFKSLPAMKANQAERKMLEAKRLQDHPEHFTSYQSGPPLTPREAKALFKKFPRIVDQGRECTITNIRETKTRGIVLDLQYSISDDYWELPKIYEAQRQLTEGRIVLDHERNIWVVKE